MATPYSTQFALTTIPQGTTVIYATPADSTVVIRDIELANFTPAEGLFLLGNALAGVLETISVALTNVASSSGRQWQGRAVFEPGQEIAVNWDHPGPLHVHVSGYLLGS